MEIGKKMVVMRFGLSREQAKLLAGDPLPLSVWPWRELTPAEEAAARESVDDVKQRSSSPSGNVV